VHSKFCDAVLVAEIFRSLILRTREPLKRFRSFLNYLACMCVMEITPLSGVGAGGESPPPKILIWKIWVKSQQF